MAALPVLRAHRPCGRLSGRGRVGCAWGAHSEVGGPVRGTLDGWRRAASGEGRGPPDARQPQCAGGAAVLIAAGRMRQHPVLGSASRRPVR